jgi:hypothetical protein
MIRVAYTRLWGFRTRTRIALTSDIRQRECPRRSSGGGFASAGNHGAEAELEIWRMIRAPYLSTSL